MSIARKTIWWWLWLAAACCRAHAVEAAPRLEDLHRDVWSGKEGAPTDIQSMTQTADGRLWLSTPNGLYWFDGVRFARFEPRRGEALLDEHLVNLYAAPTGELWFGYSGGGVSMLRDGHLVHHTAANIGAMYQAHQDPDGGLWLATLKGLLHYAGGAWHEIGPAQGLRGGVASFVFVDQYRRVWTISGGRTYVRQRAGERFVAAGPDELTGGIGDTPDGRLWIETEQHFTVVDAPRAGAALPPAAGHGLATSNPSYFDSAGNFWTNDCGAGLCLIHAADLAGKSAFRIDATPLDTLTTHRQPRVRARAFFEDAEGNMWVATTQGLERYRPQRVHSVPLDDKYRFFSLANDGPDALWLVARPGGDLWRVQDQVPTRVPGQFAYRAAQNIGGGATLFSGDRGVESRAPGQRAATPILDAKAVQGAPFEATGATFDGRHYWALDRARGPVKLVDGQPASLAALGFPAGARSVKADPEGRVWIVYDDRVVAARQGAWRAYGKADGLDVGRLQRIDADGQLLVLGNSGVAVKIGARFHTLHIDRQDMLLNAQAAITSANGDLWINAYGGLLRIAAADWRAWLARPQGTLDTELFDSADGYPGALMLQSTRMATTDDGKRVWFVGKDGLAWIDSTAIRRNRTPPRLQIVRLRAGAQRHFPGEAIGLAAGTRSLSIDYAALSYTMPERIRFKYRLDGLDDGWQDGGARRTADYTNLGPGDYRFDVVAANEDGVWGGAPASVAFTIAPLFTQTWWFFALCAAAALGSLYLLYLVRLRSVRKHLAERMHERRHERERIARTLHDTYLQSVQGLVYVFQGLAQRLAPEHAVRPALDQALALADDVLLQGRDQVMGLRTTAEAAEPLEQSLDGIGRALAATHAMAYSSTSSGAARALRGHVREELFCVGREALLNAFRHARGSQVTVVLHYEARKFTLCIEDDGQGLAPALLARGRRDGHWGLPGMRERADAMHAKLEIANANANGGGGVRIVLTVPGRSAYVNPATPWHALARRRWRKRCP